MFVQISVAGVVVLFILSGVLIPDEIFQRATDEILFDESDENGNENGEVVTYWRKALGSLDITLAVSAGLGTILTAILSYRFSQARWANMGRRIQEWIQRKETHGVKVIMQPQGSAFQSESKECLSDQFHEANDDYSATSATVTNDSNNEKKEVTEEYDTASTSSHHQQNQEDNVLKDDEIDEIITASEKASSLSASVLASKPQYQTLEARLVAVEGSLMRNFDSRMKIFEQQLEEFRSKMRDDSDKNLNLYSITAEIEATSSPDRDVNRVMEDFNLQSVLTPTKSVVYSQMNEVAIALKNALPSKRYSSSKTGINAFSEQIGDTMTSELELKEDLSGNSNDIAQGDTYSGRSSDSEPVSECSSTKKLDIPSTVLSLKKKSIPQPKTYAKPETKSEQQVIRQEVPVKQQVSSPGSPRKNTETPTSPTNTPNRKPQRTRQQMRAILQHTNEKLAQRASRSKQTNKV